MTKCADTGLVPPARGVIVSAAAFPAGFLTVKIEFSSVVVIMLIPIISDYITGYVKDTKVVNKKIVGRSNYFAILIYK